MKPHKNEDGLIEWFEHPVKTDRTLVYQFVQDCGLANQIFEICAAYGIALRTGVNLRWSWNPSRLRKFELTEFGFAHTHHEGVPLLLNKVGQGNIKIVREAERRILACELPIFSVSCPFQAEECFKEDAEQFAWETFRLPPADLPLEPGETPVGVQIRRTDYVGHSRLDVVTPAYFNNAMEYIRGEVENPRFLIESDDPVWCRHQFGKLPDVTIMNSRSSVEGLRVLASCHHNIISNSTFGWWGAWLAEKQHDGITVTPEIWHHIPGSYGDWKPIPERWHRVPVAARHRVTAIPFEDHELEEPLHDRAIVIPWKQDAGVWYELRFALRSIDAFFRDLECPIYILGTVRPPWLLFGEQRVRFLPVHSYRSALVKGLQLADKVLWMNDDTLFVNPCGWKECERTYYLRDIGPDFIDKAGVQQNPWRAGCLHILEQLRNRRVRKLRVYSTHVPYVFDREKAIEVFREFGVWEKAPFELAYYHLHPNKPTLVEDYRATDENFGDKLFLNFTDATLTPALKEAIKARLPDFAPWELKAAF